MSTKRADTDESIEYVDYPYLQPETVEKREYQTVLANASLTESTIVALPTGTGKTIVALLASVRRLSDVGGKVLFLAPTKPLVEQQAEFYQTVMDIPDHEIKVFTGDTKPDDREEYWDGATSVVVATPQVVQNDLVAGRISMEEVCHVTFDECHRATGEYAYGYIAEKYWKDAENPLVLGLSASPGTNRESILEVATNLGVTNIEVVTEDDPMLSQYTFETEVESVFVSLDDDLKKMRDLLQEIFSENLEYCKDELGVLNSKRQNISFNELQGGMQEARKQKEWRGVSVIAEAMKLHKCIETVETQGVEAFRSKLQGYVDEAENDDDVSKAVVRMVEKRQFREALELAESYDRTHPKTTALLGALKNALLSGGQAIVFTNHRKNVLALVEKLNTYGPINAHRFVGQNNDDGAGMSQKDQQETIQRFRDGEFNVLVATSVGEEGLDIPQVSLVVFYEPVASGVRSIQRRGRTGRAADGEVKVLIAKGTRDEGYWWSSKNREETMEDELGKLAEMTDELNSELGTNQATLSTYQSLDEGDDDYEEAVDEESLTPDDVESETADVEKPTFETDTEVAYIEADSREGDSSIVRRLDLAEGIEVGMSQLDVGDYILSDRVAAERKSAQDFADTLVEGRRSMFEQMGNLANNYDRPILVLEGTQDDLYGARDIHPNAIRGALQSLAVDFGVSVLWARDEEETAHHLANIAKREQIERDREVQVHGKKGGSTRTDQQEYVVSSLADVGPVTATNLLREFGSIHAVFTADVETLQQAEGIGTVTAERIVELVQAEYDPRA